LKLEEKLTVRKDGLRDALERICEIAKQNAMLGDWVAVYAVATVALSDADSHPTADAVNRIRRRLNCTWMHAYEEFILAGKNEQLVYTKHAIGAI
jgi:hypothetical protein